MRLMRATVFAMVTVIPGILLGLVAYLLLGGNSQSANPDDFMYIPCYGIPGLCIAAAGLALFVRRALRPSLYTPLLRLDEEV